MPDRQVVILGAGFGGLYAALHLERALRRERSARIVLLDKGNYHLFVPMLHEITREASIFRDDGYASIRWKQVQRFQRTAGVEFGNPDFVRQADAFGCRGFRVESAAGLAPILKEALARPGPAVIDCPVDYRENDRLVEE